MIPEHEQLRFQQEHRIFHEPFDVHHFHPTIRVDHLEIRHVLDRADRLACFRMRELIQQRVRLLHLERFNYPIVHQVEQMFVEPSFGS